jgi:hypothetical protein
VEAIRTFLDLADHPDRPCGDADALARQQLSTVESKIRQLEALRAELMRMVQSACDGSAGECRVIEALADHGLCASDHALAAT